MGLSFARPVAADFSIRAFAPRGEENADGWGLAWYPDRAVAIVKEPSKWGASHFAGFLESYPNVRSDLYIAHVRDKTTGGPPTFADTHPFAREHDGRDYALAHNGTVGGALFDRPPRRFRPIGDTDSERAFCLLLDDLERRGGHLDDAEGWAWLHARLASFNDHGKLNILMSDGRHLFAYHDRNGWKGLTFRPLALGGGQIRHLEDATMAVDLRGESITRGVVIATCPIGGDDWQPFHLGELLVIRGGVIRYSSHRESERLNLPAHRTG